ncbi:MarR family transcriptional regulator [Agromyces intestinalis]|uniref:MarR family transcriptional regulator n=1 Tax=Agromyces intestinalis TaxID=2592652 RepID=A0A5C1YHJ0_9MICO|nr:MarR family transcriptional regulator [Agromyces intestinalis]QEO14507.1 MarR family transcriptional regulator [Agromyces intestinalis]
MSTDAAEHDDERMRRISVVLDAVAVIGRELSATRDTPFGGVRLSRSQLDALFILTRSAAGLTPSSLAASLGVTAGAVTQLVDGLREQGLVEQTANPADARSRLLRLTDPARARVAAFEAAVTARLAPRFDRLSDTELDRLGRLLAKIQED